MRCAWPSDDGTLLLNTDRGSQYWSDDFQEMLKTYEMVSSMSRKGNCWDNSVAESFFGSLKTERVFFTNYASQDEAKKDIVDCIEMTVEELKKHNNKHHANEFFEEYAKGRKTLFVWILEEVEIVHEVQAAIRQKSDMNGGDLEP
ncbi:MAG: DDE-type integrase/transposase/recombinase [Chlorobiales bacterium]|nr:DDE-type integrase/transposase/recombinase [Chlorobiales bacterium]